MLEGVSPQHPISPLPLGIGWFWNPTCSKFSSSARVGVNFLQRKIDTVDLSRCCAQDAGCKLEGSRLWLMLVADSTSLEREPACSAARRDQSPWRQQPLLATPSSASVTVSSAVSCETGKSDQNAQKVKTNGGFL